MFEVGQNVVLAEDTPTLNKCDFLSPREWKFGNVPEIFTIVAVKERSDINREDGNGDYEYFVQGRSSYGLYEAEIAPVGGPW